MTTNQKRFIFVLGVLLLILTLVVWYRFSGKAELPQATQSAFMDSDKGPAYTDVNGVPTSLESYLGKVVVATAWASWSPFSANDFKVLEEVAALYEGRDVTFIAINRREPKEQAQRYLSTVAAPKGVVMVIDTEDAFYSAFSGYAMPETVILDPDGTIVQHIRNQLNTAELTAHLETVLSQ
jgi:thiol-disulfide isomerase/thioredoxin